MRSLEPMWMLGIAALIALGCGSGGTNPVDLVGDNHGEDPGPKGNSSKVGSATPPSNNVGTMTALCMQACSHVRAADCKTKPAYGVSECAGECGASSSPECDDELAAYYHCVIGAEVTCSSAGVPKVACSDQEEAHESCVSHGGSMAGCIAQPSNKYMCQYQGVPSYTYYQCSSSSPPNPQCVMMGSQAFCCP